MEQSELNKKLYEAIHKEINWLYKSEDVTQPAATACEIICKEHAIEFAEWMELQSYHIKGVDDGQRDRIYQLFTEQLNSLKNGR